MKEIQKIAEQLVLNNTLGNVLFAEQPFVLRGIDQDTIEFLENRIPILHTGKYELTATQTLAKVGEKAFQKSLTIEVEGAEPKLTPQDIYNIYPPKNSLDDYSDILPHIVLNDSIFPWANKMTLGDDLPWIALVLLSDDEIDIDTTVSAGDSISFPSKALFGTTQTVLTADNTKPFIKLTTAFKKIKDGITGKITDDNDLSKIDEKSLLICNQLPKKDKRYVVHLISLKDASFKDDNITTLSLFNWSFQTKKNKVAFNGTIEKATRQVFQLPAIQSIGSKEIIAQLKNISNDDINSFKTEITAKTIQKTITTKLQAAKKSSLQIVFQSYLQILVKDLISQIYDQKEGTEVLNNELIRSAFWLVIQTIIDSQLSSKTVTSNIDNILKIFNTKVPQKVQAVKINLFKLKFKPALLAYFSNNQAKTKEALDKITAANIDTLDISMLAIEQYPNYDKLENIFKTDKQYVFKLHDDNKVLLTTKFKNIKTLDNTPKEYSSIKTKIQQFKTNISFNDWITPIVKGIKSETENPNRLKPIHPNTLDNICQNTFLRIIKHTNINELTKAGFAPLPHFMRRGMKVVSMYRSPFVPVVPNPQQKFQAIHYPDELYRFFGFTQMLDATYVAAWELGRMLTLENEHVATAIYKWKRQYIIENKAGIQLDPFGLINPPEDILKAELFNRVIKPWLEDLMEFKNIPFAYLVPYEDMLPPNSIRFFDVDHSWLAALLDGVLSIGRIFDNEAKNKREVTWRKFEPIPNPTLGKGVLIRSAIISNYPDVIINGDGNEPISIRRLSSDIMFCLFNEPVKTIEFFLKPMGMRFGLNETITKVADIQNIIQTDASYTVATKLYKKSPKSIITAS